MTIDVRPTVFLLESDKIWEGANATLIVHLDARPLPFDLTISYDVGGTASPGQDYTALSGSITIPAGHMEAFLTIHTILDSVTENDETIAVRLLPGSNYSLTHYGARTSALTETILDQGYRKDFALTAGNLSTTINREGTIDPYSYGTSGTGLHYVVGSHSINTLTYDNASDVQQIGQLSSNWSAPISLYSGWSTNLSGNSSFIDLSTPGLGYDYSKINEYVTTEAGASDTLKIVMSITNTFDTISHFKYRRILPWSNANGSSLPDQPYLTNHGYTNNAVISSNNNPYASIDPWSSPTLDNWNNVGQPYPYLVSGDFTRIQKPDQGTLVDIDLGDIQPGDTRTFTLFLGAAPDSSTATSKLAALGATAWSMAEYPMSWGQPAFYLGFKDGETVSPEIVAGGEVAADNHLSAGGPQSDLRFVITKGVDGSGNPIPVEDGSEVEWRVEGPGGTLQTARSTTLGGVARNVLKTSQNPGDRYHVLARIVKLVKDGQSIPFDGQEIQADPIVVVPGKAATVSITSDKPTDEMAADGTSTVILTMTALDALGHPVAAGTPVNWQS